MDFVILILVVVCSVAKADCCEIRKSKFMKNLTCPSSSSFSQLSKLEGALDSRVCVFKCAVAKNCSVVFRSSSAVCYFGNAEQLSTLFSATNTPGSDVCESHVRTWESPNSETPTTSATAQTTTASPTTTALTQTPPPPPSLPSSILAKLVIFFDFRKSYFNLMNPSKYLSTPHGAITRDSDGVHFPGNSDQDYIEVDTDGNTLASTYLVQSKKFTIYSRTYRKGSHQTYHYFYDCSSNNNRGEFFDDGGKIRFAHQFSSSVLVKQSGTAFIFPSFSQLASVGVIFDGSTLTNFYNYGILMAVNSDSTTISGSPLCLRLGYNSNPLYSLQGRFVCYAVANDSLTESELTDIGLYCG